jgi:hypothetical protein
MVALSTGNRYSFLSQDVADLALRDRYTKLILKPFGQLVLRQGRVLSFLLS